MTIIEDYPPNFEKICEHIPTAREQTNAVFTYGEYIFNPSKSDIEDHLEHHEEVHMRQQAEMGRDEWWEKYLTDVKFRLQEEKEAYREQYKFAKRHYNRGESSWLLKQVATDLSGPLYGHILTYKQARSEITK